MTSLRGRIPGLLKAAAISLAAAWVYGPALRGRWQWDDDLEITANPLLKDAAGLRRIWFSSEGYDYYPLKSTVQWIEWHLWGAETAGYHAVSLALLIAAALLLWRVLGKLGVEWAWFGGFLFAVHPLAAESAAWIAEFKNALSLPPLLLAASAYLNFDDKWGQAAAVAGVADPGCRPQRGRLQRHLTPSLVWFFAAMLCKSSVLMFPFLILLLALWRRGRVGARDLRASAPFFAVSLVLGGVEWWYQAHRALGSAVTIEGAPVPIGGVAERLAAAGAAIPFYFAKALVPVRLLAIYPRWAMSPFAAPSQWLPWVAAASVGAWLWTKRAGWGGAALCGIACAVFNLAPVLGFLPMAYLRMSRVADHFAYVFLACVAGLAAAAFAAAARRWRIAAPALAVAAAVTLASLGRGRAGDFRGPKELWTRTVSLNPGTWSGQNNLGNVFLEEGRMPEAEAHFEAAIRIKFDDAEARNGLGVALDRQGRLAAAAGEFERALQVDPDYAGAQNNLGMALYQSGAAAESLAHYRKALELQPDYPDAANNLGLALMALRRRPEADAEFEEALRLRPDYAPAHDNFGDALALDGRYAEAVSHFAAAARCDPSDVVAEIHWGNALWLMGRPSEARLHYEAALRIDPNSETARKDLALLDAQGL